jgi:predicted dehydrogenase
MHTLIFPNPGHFHAALTLRDADPRLSDEIYVYAEGGAELDAFLALVEAFNTRREQPTRWRPRVYTGEDWFARLVAERKGDLAVLAGKNDRKMRDIRALRQAGFHVLADKPWVIDEAGLAPLREAMGPVSAGPPLVMDIMTERHELTLVLLRTLLHAPAIFGGFRTRGLGAEAEAQPALEVQTTHQLYKTVNGEVLVRYPWYFDVRVQGDGVVDIPTHLVDQVQWLVGGHTYDYERDVELVWARRWNTDLDPEAYRRITRIEPFPSALAPYVRDGVLGYPCNGAIGYRLRGVPVRVQSVWGLTTAPTADDYRLVCRGERADIVLEHGAHANSGRRLRVTPRGAHADAVAAALRAQVRDWQAAYPGIQLLRRDDGWDVQVPTPLLIGHEEHFARVLHEFLGYVERGAWPAHLAPNIVTKYTVLAKASALAGRG